MEKKNSKMVKIMRITRFGHNNMLKNTDSNILIMT